MIIDKKNKITFIHIQKCGGKTITKILRDYLSNTDTKKYGTPYDFRTYRTKPMGGHNGVNDQPVYDKYRNNYNFISIRDPLKIHCSKYLNMVRENKQHPSRCPAPPPFESYIEEVLKWPLLGSLNHSGHLIQITERFPNVGRSSARLLYQTCRMENINKYTDEEEFFKSENLIDSVVGMGSMYEDLEKIFKRDIKKIPPENSSKPGSTMELVKKLSSYQKSKILERERITLKLCQGEYDSYLRGNSYSYWLP